MKLQKRRSGDQYSEQKKSPGLLHTWKNDRKAGGGAYRHQRSCRVRNKLVSFRALGKRSKPQVQLLERLVVAARGRQLQGMTDISSCRRKEADGSQQASLLSNGATSVAVYCDQTPSQRGLFARRPECCLPLKVDHRRHRLQWCRKHKNWTTD
ncbi:hypothetical protein TNCV_740931 [Trichonephila clavipes]|nr:hypothetical protein TNCV_740931 [Trichonephila clavipes]